MWHSFVGSWRQLSEGEACQPANAPSLTVCLVWFCCVAFCCQHTVVVVCQITSQVCLDARRLQLIATLLRAPAVLFLFVVCFPGYGGTGNTSTCPAPCGGFGRAATYGPAGRTAGNACVPCSSQRVTYGYSFDWQKANDVFVPRIVSKTGATSSAGCLSEFGQLTDGAFYLPLQSDVATVVTSGITAFADCVALCLPDSCCQFVTYGYVAKTCTVRNAQGFVFIG